MNSAPNNPDDAVQYWINRLEATGICDEPWLEAVEALHALGFEVVPTMIEALANKKLSVRLGVGNALKKLGSTAFYDLIEALKHETPSVRQHAALLLYGSAIRDDAQIADAVPALVEALKDADCFVRQWAAVALEWLGPRAEEAVPGLIAVLDDPEYMVRRWAAAALGAIGQAAKSAMPELTEVLLDDEPEVREAASEAIDQIQAAVEPPLV